MLHKIVEVHIILFGFILGLNGREHFTLDLDISTNNYAFSSTHMPTNFQQVGNDIFNAFFNIFMIVYLDDILIFSKTMSNSRSEVFLLRSSGIPCYIILIEFTFMDLAKLQTILDLQTPRFMCDVQCFLVFTVFYRKFIKLTRRRLHNLH